MGRPKVYATPAERTAAYRARRAAQDAPGARSASPGYTKWRKAVQEATSLLSTTYDELDAWTKERSERRQESDRAGELAADKDKLWEIIDGLEDLSIGGRAS